MEQTEPDRMGVRLSSALEAAAFGHLSFNAFDQPFMKGILRDNPRPNHQLPVMMYDGAERTSMIAAGLVNPVPYFRRYFIYRRFLLG
jgi:hypothetical protein